MRIFKLTDQYYCEADNGFTYEELKKKITDILLLRKNSFAELYSKKILQDIFQYAIDLKKEYLTYYQQEYEDFTDYLYKKKLLNRKDIKLLNLSDHQTVLSLDIHLSSYNADSLLNDYEENGIDVLNKALKEIVL